MNDRQHQRLLEELERAQSRADELQRKAFRAMHALEKAVRARERIKKRLFSLKREGNLKICVNCGLPDYQCECLSAEALANLAAIRSGGRKP